MPDPLPTAPADPVPLALVPRVEQASRYYAQAKAANTLRSYRTGWQHFVTWCAAHALQALPATPQTLVLYLTARAEQVTPSTLASRVAAIRFSHQQSGYESPTTHPIVRDVLSGIRRMQGTRPAQVHGLTRDLLTRLLLATGESLRDRRNRALVAVAYDLLGRRSELVALAVEDLERAPDGSATVLIRRSKTDPEGAGVPLYLAPDTMTYVEVWLRAAGITTGLVFRALTKGGRVRERLSADAVARVFKQMAQVAGLAPQVVQGIAGHSARVGAAQDMAIHGIDLAGIMQAGRWKTPQMAGRYIERITARRGAAAQLAARQHRLAACGETTIRLRDTS
jgi:site-specific recombinase XerD